ncbi:TPA: hypothetical protein N3K56_000450 [Klebsiella aerogenes]|nr:hypothetical protein [Klebsiella aerogenes]HCM5081342.1 hypothetical protein [Klebsiella aerogenes]HCU2313474.1 hypothetical protein [Klebsiella aerogenes]
MLLTPFANPLVWNLITHPFIAKFAMKGRSNLSPDFINLLSLYHNLLQEWSEI